jgi:hypothetical protein
MLKSLMSFECKVNDYVSHFHFPAGMPIDHAEQSVVQVMQWLGKCREEAARVMAEQTAKAELEKVEKIPEENVKS